MKPNLIWQKNNFTIRFAQPSDFEPYFNNSFCPPDKEVIRLTGSKEKYTKAEVKPFFQNAIKNEDFYLFLILSPNQDIIGEVVINEIDHRLRCANFRIAIFSANAREKGIGSWAVRCIRDFAFEYLKLHRLELDVFDFNPRAKHCYLKAGFKQEGILRDAVLDGETYANSIIMSILEDEWKEIRKVENNKENPI